MKADRVKIWLTLVKSSGCTQRCVDLLGMRNQNCIANLTNDVCAHIPFVSVEST